MKPSQSVNPGLAPLLQAIGLLGATIVIPIFEDPVVPLSYDLGTLPLGLGLGVCIGLVRKRWEVPGTLVLIVATIWFVVWLLNQDTSIASALLFLSTAQFVQAWTKWRPE